MAATASQRWREALDEWRIPPAIRTGAVGSPWPLPVTALVGRARSQVHAPSGASYDAAIESLPPGGTVLDVGAGPGAASLALGAHCGSITAVDGDEDILATLVELAAAASVVVRTVTGRWPDIAPDVAPADVVVCHHVLYNVPDLHSFVTALTAHARTRVVVEVTTHHPASLLNPLWQMLHGIQRPTRPTAVDAIDVICSTGVRPRWRTWRRPITPDGTDYAELIASTCRRLCLGPERLGDVEAALRHLGVGPDRPYLGEPTRELVTIWWDTDRP